MAKKALGKGLEALLPRFGQDESQRIADVPVDRVDPNPHQPRREFDEDLLRELASSIKASGLLQPIVVMRDGDRFTVVVGERRLRASRLAGLETIPAVIRECTEEDLLHLALIENIQREDLNAIEQARAFQQYMNQFGVTQEDLAGLVGKDRSVVANTVRLLNLPASIQEKIRNGILSPGHARGLLSLDDAEQQENLAERIVQEAWTVRQTEQITRRMKQKPMRKKKTPAVKAKSDPHVNAVQDRLMRYLGTKVSLVRQHRGGSIVISWFDEDDLTRLLDLMTHP